MSRSPRLAASVLIRLLRAYTKAPILLLFNYVRFVLMSRPSQTLLYLSWPIYLELLLGIMTGFADTYFLSRISTSAAAGVGATLALFGLVNLATGNLARAAGNIAAQHIGAGNDGRARECYGLTIWLVVSGGALSGFLVYFGAPTFCRLIGLTGKELQYGVTYLQITCWAYLFYALRQGISSILESQGKTKVNLQSSLCFNGLNLIFNTTFLSFFHDGSQLQGVQGIAGSTALAWIGGVIYAAMRAKQQNSIGVRLLLSRQAVRENLTAILKIAVPAAIEPLSFQSSQIILTSYVVSIGSVALATRIYVSQLLTSAILLTVAFSHGSMILVARHIGAQRFAMAGGIIFKAVRYSLTGTLTITTLFLCFPGFFLGIFTVEAEIIALARPLFIIAFLADVGRCLNIIIGANLRACGDAFFNSSVGTLVMWSLGIPLAYVLGIYWEWGLVGIYIAGAVDELVRGGICLWRWQTDKWQTKGIYAC